MTIGERIKEIRKSRGMTQLELAKKICTTPQNVSQYERGIRKPKVETITKISHALDVSPSDLLGIKPAKDKRSGNNADSFDSFLDYLQCVCRSEGIEVSLWQPTSKEMQSQEEWDSETSFFWSVSDKDGVCSYSFRTNTMQELYQKVSDYMLFLLKKMLEVPKIDNEK